jgi:hypothetical protein
LISTALSGWHGGRRGLRCKPLRIYIAAKSWPISTDLEPFQEWLAAERDRALALVCDVLQRLTTTAEPGESEAAVQCGRRLVASTRSPNTVNAP